MNYYRIGSRNPAGHYFHVELIIEQPDPEGQKLRLPTWIPGSYMIREFARNLIDLSISNGDKALAVNQLDKTTWQVEACDQALRVSYRVYAWDLSVRSAHLDQTHGFFNGSSVFLEVVGQQHQPCRVTIEAPALTACQHWRLATTLSRQDGNPDRFAFGDFLADDYQELIDHPVEMGEFQAVSFDVYGIPHDMVFSGRFELDENRLVNDLTPALMQHIDLFGQPAPMQRYLFLVMVVGNGYGGLEHRSSTSLMCSRDDLPKPGQSKKTDAYRQFLGLCSHEYFHSWNVKRIKPAVFNPPDLSREVHTPLLWAFEGITSYYDDLALVRAGSITPEEYLEAVAMTWTRVQRGIGRMRQSIADSSFNAWTKFYRQDENAGNAIVSYYTKGMLVALCIDLTLRKTSNHQKSLDDVMRQLWQRYLETAQGVSEKEIQQLVNEIAGSDLTQLLDQWIYGTEELPLETLLDSFGIAVEYRASNSFEDKGGKASDSVHQASIGCELKQQGEFLTIVSTREEGAAQKAGLSAGDLLVAINGVKASVMQINDLLLRMQPGEALDISYFRRDELMQTRLSLQSVVLDRIVLKVKDEKNEALSQWLRL